jgi:hypothetical protein
MSTNNPLIKMALANYKEVASKNGVKYDKRVEAKKEARIEKLQLRLIAKLYLEGNTQKAIAKITSKSESTISDNLRIIRSEFPELLQQNPENSTNSDELGEFLVGGNPENSETFGEFDNDSANLDMGSENPENSDEFGKFGEFDKTQRNPENSENSDHVNDNVNVNENVNENDNVNMARPSSNEEVLPVISLEELNQMGAVYKDIGGGVIEFPTGKKMRLAYEF